MADLAHGWLERAAFRGSRVAQSDEVVEVGSLLVIYTFTF